jgi:tetratricopeptide (TPR) repeat protein
VSFFFSRTVALLSLLVLTTAGLPARGLSSNSADPIQQDLVTGHAQDALNRISSALAENPQDAVALELRCRVLLQERQWSAAASSCQAAVAKAPQSSEAHYWLGRAYGEQAQRAPRMSAFLLARKLDAEFQQAVMLDPSNLAAYEALGQFDLQAPAIAGGGLGKARVVVSRLRSLSPAAAHALAAGIAESEKNYSLAEQEWKAEIATSQDPAEAWMDLAGFYHRRGDIDAMVRAVETGVALDKQHTIALVDAAHLLIQTGRNLPEAAQWLREYLASSHKSEDAPAFAVHAQLAALLNRMGQTAQAQEQMARAESLAPGYKPRS